MSMIHKWEANGLGKAPFTCVGVFSLPSRGLQEANPDAYNNALRSMPQGYGVGSCGVCGIGLVHNFLIHSSCGKKFSVGCDCVERSGNNNLIDQVKYEKRKAKREEKAKAQQQAFEARMAEQKARNGGLTDYEVAQAKHKAEHEARIANVLKHLSPLVVALEEKGTSFALELVASIKAGQAPYGRGVDLCCTMYGEVEAAKATGKTRGKAFKEAKDAKREEAYAFFDNLEKSL